jgi:hypothetical protein
MSTRFTRLQIRERRWDFSGNRRTEDRVNRKTEITRNEVICSGVYGCRGIIAPGEK